MSNFLLIIISFVILIILWFIGIYNSLIRSKIRVEEAWSDIEIQLKRRYDLIPNLVEIVKGYAGHEKEVLERVIEARSRAMNAQTIKEHREAENLLSGTLKTLFALAESYPNLKANQNFLELQRELTDTEDKIQAARRFYNSNVRDYNIKIRIFPNNLVANLLKLKPKEFFDIEEREKEGIKIQF